MLMPSEEKEERERNLRVFHKKQNISSNLIFYTFV